MKILHVNKYYTNTVGGVETVARNVVEALAAAGIENEVLACDLGPGRVETHDGIRVRYAHAWRVVKSVPLSLSFYWHFFVRARRADALFLHHPFPPGFLAYLLFAKRRPLYVWYHSDIVRQRAIGFLIRPITNAVLRRARKIFVSSRHVVSESRVLREFQATCAVVPFGIDGSSYAPTAERLEQAAAIRERYGTPLVLAVGRLVHYKGLSYLVDAMRETDARLLIVGKGKLRESLDRQIAEAGLAGRVAIIPHVPALAPYYLAADIVVFPSTIRSETFGLVQLEAMASGTPVINTDVHPGVAEVSLDGVTGYTVAKEDSAALSRAIRALLADDALRVRFGASAEARARTTFDIRRFNDLLVRAILRW